MREVADSPYSAYDIQFMLDNIDKFTQEQQEEIIELIDEHKQNAMAEEAYNDLIAFCQYMMPEYIVGRHHRKLADLLMELEKPPKKRKDGTIIPNKLDRIGVSIPPRHGKSEISSKYFVAWFLGRNPDKKVIMASHTGDLSKDFGREVRNIIASDRYQELFPGVRLAADSKAAGSWDTNFGGKYYACGVGAALAGRGADLLIIDDPHALEVSTLIPTPNGFVEIQHLKVGDEVYGPDGMATKVVSKSDVWHERELYSVITDDNKEVLCDAQHLWGVNSDTNLAKARVDAYRTEYLAHQWNRANKPIIPKHMPVKYPEVELPIDPWVLGAWLGDGTTSSGRVTADPKNGDQKYMLEQFKEAGYQTSPITEDGWTFNVYGLMPQLRKLGVLNNKHVPEIYMTASVDQRMALLQGLIDTDGSVTANGQAGFYNCNEQLVDAVVEILHSLGVKCQRRTYEDTRQRYKTAKPNHRVMFRLAGCARMPRKLDTPEHPQTNGPDRYSGKHRTTGTVQCITVEREDGLFLAGRGYVVTHNSEQDILAGNFDTYERAYKWYTTGARTRLMPGGRVAIIHTRWSEEDLLGRLTRDMTRDSEADQFELFEFPALLEIEQADGTKVEKALWPQFFDVPALKRTKASMPAYQWNAQYQQKPTGEEAALIKRQWYRTWRKPNPPACDYIIMTLDAAAEANNRADYTALTVWGVFMNEEEDMNQVILLDTIQERVEFPELKGLAKEMYDKWTPDSFIVEKKSSGTPLYQELRRGGVMVSEYTPTRGTTNNPNTKYARLNSVADIVKEGMVWVPEHKWAEDFVEEVAGFPNKPHDDLVDCFIMAMMRFRSGGFIRLPSDPKDENPVWRRKKSRGYHY